METPNRTFAIDWSGARIGAHRRIWLAEADQNGLSRLESGRSSSAIVTELLSCATLDPNFVVGLDFAFSFPAWFLDLQGITSSRALWELAEQRGEDWLQVCAAPFWGRSGKSKPGDHLDRGFRQAELILQRETGRLPKSVFQIGGAGSVGAGSIRGMPVLRALQDAGFSIWPFDPPSLPLVVEIYPRIHTGPVVKSSQPARVSYLASRGLALSKKILALAEESEDAFDAAISALAMMDAVESFCALTQACSEPESREGAIWRLREAPDAAKCAG